MSRLVIPADFIESKCFINPRGVYTQADAGGGRMVQVPAGAVVTLKEIHDESVVYDNPTDGFLGPKGTVAMDKDQIGFITRVSSIERALTLPPSQQQ